MASLFFLLVIVLGLIGYSSLSHRIRILERRMRQGEKDVLPADAEPAVSSQTSMETKVEIPEAAPMQFLAKAPKRKSASSDLEFKVGAKVFTAVGVIAVLFGVGFFLQYAFEHNLISPVLRIVIGFVLSIACVALGEWLRKKYAKYGQTLMGLGLGIAYLAWYSSLHLYHLINAPVVFIGMMAVTGIGLWMALRLHSAPLAVCAQIGGFLTPPLVGGRENQYMALFSYLLLLDLAVLALAYLKSWREVTLVGIMGTAAVFTGWFFSFHRETPWIFPFLFVTIVFILFSIASLLRYTKQRMNLDSGDLFILTANPFFYAIGVYAIIPHEMNLLTGIWFAVIGLIYLALTSLVRGKEVRDRRYQNALAVIGTVFLAIAIPIAFDGRVVIISWAILTAALVGWGYVIRSRVLLFFAHLVAILPAISILVYTRQNYLNFRAWLNADIWSNIAVIACMGLIACMHWYHQKKNALPNISVSEYSIMFSFAAIEAYLLACLVLFYEVQHTAINHIWTIACLTVIALLGAWIGAACRSFGLRLAAFATFFIMGLRFAFVFHPIRITTFVLNSRFAVGLIFIATLGIAHWIYAKRYADRLLREESRCIQTIIFIGMHLFGLYLLSTEIFAWFTAYIFSQASTLQASYSLHAARNAALSVSWMVYAIALLVFGILKKSVTARKFAIVLFSVTVLKAFLYDTASFDSLYRFISFMILGILLLVSGYLYHRFKDRIRKFVS